MPTIIAQTFIRAPIEICFDAARDISLHCQTSAHTGERAVAGVTSGPISLGESVTFEATHFGVRQRLSSRITRFEPPFCFVDEMTRGAFASMKHLHQFVPHGDGTIMTDTLIWTAPWGILGRIANKVALERHMRNFLIRRNAKLKIAIEAK